MAPRSRLLFLSLLIPAARLVAQEPVAAPASTAVVRGTVHDSIAGVPLAGAVVQLVQEPPSGVLLPATTDSLGRFELTGVPAGTYLAGFFHEREEALGIRPRVFRLRVAAGDTVRFEMGTPSPRSVHAAICGAAARGDSTGGIVGRVRDADTDAPLANSTVVLVWPELVLDRLRARTQLRQVAARSDADGWFAICGVPIDAEVTMRAELATDSSGFVPVDIPLHGVTRQTLRIGRSNTAIPVAVDSTGQGATLVVRRGSARLTGRVLRADGAPLQDAQVALWGSDAAAITAEDGSFTMSALPAGTYTVEAKVVGFEPTRAGVQLRSDSTTTVTIRVEKPIPVLESVVVFGERRRNRFTDALERRERGFGRFFTRADIEGAGVIETTDLLRRVPGVRVVPTGRIGYAVLMRGNCLPSLWVDGIRYTGFEEQLAVMPRPHEIAIMEVYNGPETPAQFGPGGCGAVVIWTGR